MDYDYLSKAANPTGRPRAGENAPMIKVGDREVLLSRVRAEAFRGSDWFFWIAGFSAVNSLLASTGRMFSFGLGTSLWIHYVGNGYATSARSASWVPTLTVVLEALTIGFFILCGFLARRGWLGAFFFGATAYALDAVLMARYGMWLAVIFHLVALVFIWRTMPVHIALAQARRAQAAGTPTISAT